MQVITCTTLPCIFAMQTSPENERTIGKWIDNLYTKKFGTFLGLLAGLLAALLALVPAALSVSSVEWADTAAKWATFLTAVATIVLAVVQVVVNCLTYINYTQVPHGTCSPFDDEDPQFPQFKIPHPSTPTISVNGVEYYVIAHRICHSTGRSVKVLLYNLPNGDISARGVNNGDTVYICQVGLQSYTFSIVRGIVVLHKRNNL